MLTYFMFDVVAQMVIRIGEKIVSFHWSEMLECNMRESRRFNTFNTSDWNTILYICWCVMWHYSIMVLVETFWMRWLETMVSKLGCLETSMISKVIAVFVITEAVQMV